MMDADKFCSPFPFFVPPLLHQPCSCSDPFLMVPHAVLGCGCPLLPMGDAGSLAFHTAGPDQREEEPGLAGEQGEMGQGITSVQSTCCLASPPSPLSHIYADCPLS